MLFTIFLSVSGACIQDPSTQEQCASAGCACIYYLLISSLSLSGACICYYFLSIRCLYFSFTIFLSLSGACIQDPSTQEQCASAGCAQNCKVEDGSPVCFCDAGYEPDADGQQCNDIDECTQGLCAQECENSQVRWLFYSIYISVYYC